MSFFADPWLFNCRNDKDQKAIIQAICELRATRSRTGVVLVAAAGQRGIDLNHPTTDEISPDFPPGCGGHTAGEQQLRRAAAQSYRVVVVSRPRAQQNLLPWYSTYGNIA